jgi:hypothetical protein
MAQSRGSHFFFFFSTLVDKLLAFSNGTHISDCQQTVKNAPNLSCLKSVRRHLEAYSAQEIAPMKFAT